MVNIIELKASGKSIIIQGKKAEKWYEVSLINQNKKIILGYENIDIIIERFYKLFNKNILNKTGELDGKDIYWIMSLNEIHHSIYINFDNEEINMFFENSEGKIIQQMKITQFEQQEWKKILTKL